ncbi:MAG: hypothetical protein COV75_01985 [Candidatus Omnitrophica bacterium CG11_big_fil_rev_8_21_14_0_20_63_9]|nr:MAG: hypothetical protein COV75_01985 [Candidatus Omnitrophica bacterium CG11_big_fil_rev_8_21_14_0_20_63_9]
MRRRTVFLMIAGCCAASLGLLVWAAGTTGGSQWLAQQALKRVLGASSVHIRSAAGNLLSGLTLHDVKARRNAAAWWGTHLAVEALHTAPWMLSQPAAWRVVLQGAESHGLSAATSLTIGRLEIERRGSLVAHDVLAHNLNRLPGSSVLEVQRIHVEWPWRLNQVRLIHNGRLRLPYAEPVALSAWRSPEGPNVLRAFTHSLDVESFLRTIGQVNLADRFTGTLKDVDVALQGSAEAFFVTTSMHVEQLSRKGFSLAECPMTASLSVKDAGAHPKLEGLLLIRRGVVHGPQTSLIVQRSTVTFTGEPRAPTLDIRATSQVGGTAMRVVLRGTPQEPQLHLSSDPPMSEKALLAMLATGKQWRGAQEVLTQGAVTSDLAVDFIDYFMFGGAGSRLAQRLGISELSVTHDTATNRMGVRTTIKDRVELGVEVDPSAVEETSTSGASSNVPVLPYKVGAEYHVTNQTSVQLEGERTPLPTRNHVETPDDAGSGIGQGTVQTDDKVLLKVKRRF